MSTLLFHLCCISLSLLFVCLFVFSLAPLEVSFSQVLGLYYFFPLVFAFGGNVGWMVCADSLLGVTCARVLVEGDQVDNYRDIGTYTHTVPHMQL